MNTDILISISLTLFMLSLITEKVSNFIKLNMKETFSKALDKTEDDKIRETRIQILSACIGISVAIACHADFFQIIREKGTLVAWENWDQFKITKISEWLGFIITGLFLSQGSKFFHDLLDTLLFIKNTRRALSDKQAMEMELLKSNVNYDADSFIAKVTGEQRDDDDDVHL